MVRTLVTSATLLLVASFAAGSFAKPPAKKTASAKKTATPATTTTTPSSAGPVDDPSATPTAPATGTAPDDSVRCKPSCYHTERPANRGHETVLACGYYERDVFQDPTLAGWGPSYIWQSANGTTAVPSCKFPKPTGGKWASMESWIGKNLDDKQPGDVIVVPASESWERAEGQDGDVKRGITFRKYSKKLEFQVNFCGSTDDKVTCEADGSPAARAANVTHYRLEEAKKLKAANKNAECQAASLEAIATARGFAKEGAGLDFNGTFKTRFDGTLAKKDLVAKVAALGKEAETVYASCGGAGPAKTTPADEQAYHARW